MTRSFLEARVRLPAAHAEAAELALLELGAEGTAQELRSERDAEVIGYFTRGAAPEPAAVRDAVRRWCAIASASAGARVPAEEAVEVELCRQPWEDWVTRTQQVLSAFAPTPHLRVAPPWDLPTASPRDGRTSPRDLLIIEPGQAFGTGTHSTTRGCLELLEDWRDRAPGGAALDVGTGTGILALRAVQLGYAPVIACDNDAVALADAQRNARLNRLESSVTLFVGEAHALRRGVTFALILANLYLNPLRALAPFFIDRLQPGGGLILSGYHRPDAEALARTFRPLGLEPVRTITREGWVAACLRRAGRTKTKGRALPARPSRLVSPEADRDHDYR